MLLSVVVAIGLSGLGAAGVVAAVGPGELNATAAAQISALQAIKESLTPAERKLDSRLVLAERQRVGKLGSVAGTLPKLQSGVAVSSAGTTLVDVAASQLTSHLSGRLVGVGAKVLSESARAATLRARVPVSALTVIAGWADVRRVSVASGFLTAGASGLPVQGSVVSQGDKAEAANVARKQTHVTGFGVKVCVLSDGVNSLADAQDSGDLPAVDVLPFMEGAGDEGTAMLEIIHDLAPGAALGFATADISDSSFADNIRALRFVAHCDVIVDDVLYFNEDPFQDGPIAQAVNDVTADGAVYFSSAGNEGNTIDRTSGNYEGDFVASGQSIKKFAGVANDFAAGPGVQVFEPLGPVDFVPVTLWWADPLGHANDDYDLYLLDSAGNVVAASQDVQNGSQDPMELLRTPIGEATGLRLAVVKFKGAARYFQLSALRGRFEDSTDGLVAQVRPGVTRGHSATVNAFSVAAAPAAAAFPDPLEPGDPPNPSGPYPNAFTSTQLPERFTSDGPRRVFFTSGGSAITPGNFTATGGAVRAKPDVTAADGVRTTLDFFNPFFGTSAAAPHAAAIAALVLSGNPGASAALVRQAFTSTALDLTPPGRDNRSGFGVLRADLVLASTGATPQPDVVPAPPTVTASSDGDSFLEHGETGQVSVPVTGVGDGKATNVTVQVSSADPQVTVAPPTQSYGTVLAKQTVAKPFTVQLASSYPKGKPLFLSVTVTFGGRLSPSTALERVPTGQPAATARSFAFAGPAVAIPDADTTGVTVPLAVSGLGYGAKLTLSVDGTACSSDAGATTVGIDHTFVEDLVGELIAPSGRTATLFRRSGGGGNNLCQVVFDDAAAQPFTSVTSDQAPFTGSWRPAEPLTALLDQPVDGTWQFHVADVANADTGSVRAVSLHITGFTN
jgi:subtilisin-like proprotein convertase family protein